VDRRLQGAYLFPKGITGSAIYEARSGQQTARTVQFTGGRQIPHIVVSVEPTGSIKLKTLHTLDLRAAKSFNLGRSRTVEARLNMFNALNINDAISVNVRSGASYLLPTSIVLPRVLDFSVLFRF
jgi:hypothetical protein